VTSLLAIVMLLAKVLSSPLPPPIPAPLVVAVALTVLPEMVMEPTGLVLKPPPMPALPLLLPLPPVTSTLASVMEMAPVTPLPHRPPPMPAPLLLLTAVMVPPEMAMGPAGLLR
jgi:hypothetical protein